VEDIMGQINGLFEEFLDKVAAQCVHDRDLIRVHISHRDVIQNGDITVSLRPFAEMTADAVSIALSVFLQSNEALQFDEEFEIAAGVINIPRVSGRPRKRIQHLNGPDNSLVMKKSTDNLCLARRLAVCEAHYKYKKLETIQAKEYKLMCDCRPRRQGKRAAEIQAMAGVESDRPNEIIDIIYFEGALDAQIVVFSSRHENTIIYRGSKGKSVKYYVYLKASDTPGQSTYKLFIIIKLNISNATIMK
jgi:hypothetical protein